MDSHAATPTQRMGRFLLPIFLLLIIPFFPSQTKESDRISTPVALNGPIRYTLENGPTKFQKYPGQKPLCPRETRYHPIILAASMKYNVDPALVKAIIKAESGYNPTAVSKKGAVGLMQLMPATANVLGVEDLFNPEHNINGGVKYLRQLINRFAGNLELAVAAYNSGIGSVSKYEGIPPYKATRYYVKTVLKYYRCYKDSLDRENSKV